MRVPKRFKLYAQTIEVSYDTKACIESDCYGLTIFNRNKILLKPGTKEEPRSKQQIEKTFYHELIHWILFFSTPAHDKEFDLYRDEGLVDTIANLLQQAVNTMEY